MVKESLFVRGVGKDFLATLFTDDWRSPNFMLFTCEKKDEALVTMASINIAYM